MTHTADIHEFFIEGKKAGLSHVLLAVTEPSTPEELEKGYFFALVDIHHATIETIDTVQHLIDTLEQHYYAENADEQERAFETVMESVNKRATTDLLPEQIKNIHCIVGVI